MARSLAAGRRVKLPHVGLFADGVAVKQVGKETFRLAREYVDEMVLVDTDAICAALKDVFEDTRVDPRAGRRAGDRRRQGVGASGTRAQGPDVRRDRLRRQHELRPAALRRRARRAGRAARGDPRGDDSRAARAASASSARCSASARSPNSTIATPIRGSRTCSSASKSRIAARPSSCSRRCARGRIEAYDLSDNEMAKLHVRHLVGGHAPAAEHEILYRFEFPERPGALMRFLDSMSARLEHQPVPLPQPRRRLRPRAGRHAGAARDKRRVPALSRPPRLRLRRRIGQSGVPDVPRPLSDSRSPGGTTCRETAHRGRSKICRDVAFSSLFGHRADSGKLYALVKLPGPWQTRLGPVRRGRPRGDLHRGDRPEAPILAEATPERQAQG